MKDLTAHTIDFVAVSGQAQARETADHSDRDPRLEEENTSLEQPNQCGSINESEHNAMRDSELVTNEQDCESAPIPRYTYGGGIEEDFTASEEEDAPCLPRGTGKTDPCEAAGGHSPVKNFRRDVACDPSLARSKYSLQA